MGKAAGFAQIEVVAGYFLEEKGSQYMILKHSTKTCQPGLVARKAQSVALLRSAPRPM